MTDQNETRLAFADFLTRLATDDDSEWEQYVVTHYADAFLEEIRRCVVRMRNYSTAVWGNQGSKDTLSHWATALRLSTDTELPATDYSHIKLTLTGSEFVVLDSLLRRFSETDDYTVDDATERQALYNLQCLCEKHDAHGLLPSMQDARRELSGE